MVIGNTVETRFIWDVYSLFCRRKNQNSMYTTSLEKANEFRTREE